MLFSLVAAVVDLLFRLCEGGRTTQSEGDSMLPEAPNKD
jgi:hypothetical protein